MVKSIEWLGDRLRFLDQSELPVNEKYVETSDYTVVAEAIRSLRLRGAPLIGIAAAYGVALAAVSYQGNIFSELQQLIQRSSSFLAATRPTAVNLFYALRRMQNVAGNPGDVAELRRRIVGEADAIHREDFDACRMIGEHGSALIPSSATILTHCNTGALATGGNGTAQSVITTGVRAGKSIKVYVDETRPAFQGARLTMWELMQEKIDATLITDSTGASLMREANIDLVIVGADRIAANGDTANKIGSYNLAVLAHYHHIPFYVAAPRSTIDCTLVSGNDIPIEERSAVEISEIRGFRVAPAGAAVFAPAFDMIPSSLITAIITESGIHKNPYSFS